MGWGRGAPTVAAGAATAAAERWVPLPAVLPGTHLHSLFNARFPASGLVEYHYLTADAEALADRSATLTVVTDSSAGPIQLIIPPPVDEKHGRNWQMNVYSACLLHFGVRHRWMGAWQCLVFTNQRR